MKNVFNFTVLEHNDILDFKSPSAFPDYSLILSDKTEEIMIMLQLCQKQLIPSCHYRFYETLPVSQGKDTTSQASPKKN